MEKRAVIIHIITTLELGGAQQTTLYTVAHLDRERYLPLLICGPEGLLLPEARSMPDVTVRVCPHLVRAVSPIKDLRALISLWRILRQERAAHPGPVIVHTHSSKAGVLGRWAAFCAGIPIRIHTVHGFGIHPYQPWIVRGIFTLAEMLTGRITTRMVYVSMENLRTGIGMGVSRPSNSLIIRSGIDREGFAGIKGGNGGKDFLQKTLNIKKKGWIVGMIACLKPQKAPLDFVRMADRVRRELPDTHFVLVGDGVLRDAVEDMVREFGMQHHMHLTGWRRDIPRLLAGFDIMALTSLWEGLPKVVVEAQAAGIPVVATKTAGVDEVVREGETGFMVPPGSPGIMASRVIELLNNPHLMACMGRNARSVSREFDLREGLKMHEGLYEDLINGKEFRNNKQSGKGYDRPNSMAV
ncbi:MAG: glycosyltransferase family 4 protein [bacterium]